MSGYAQVRNGSRQCKNVFPPPKTARNRERSASTRRSEQIFALSIPESTRAQARATLSDLNDHMMRTSTSCSRSDCHQERLDADDVYYAREVVGEYVQRHHQSTGSCSSAQKPASVSRPLYAGRRLPSHQERSLYEQSMHGSTGNHG